MLTSQMYRIVSYHITSQCDLRVVEAVDAVVQTRFTDTLAVSITLTFHRTVRANVAKLTTTQVRKYATPILTSLTADRLTDTPDKAITDSRL